MTVRRSWPSRLGPTPPVDVEDQQNKSHDEGDRSYYRRNDQREFSSQDRQRRASDDNGVCGWTLDNYRVEAWGRNSDEVHRRFGHCFGMLVRGVREDELGRLKELRLRALFDSPASFGRRYDEEVDRDPNDYLGWVTDGITLVAEDDGGWHGLVGILVDREDPSLSHLLSMWTEPAYRGRGLGRKLVEAAVNWSQQNGATRVRLGVVEDNWPAIHLYQQAGFEPTGQWEAHRSDRARRVMFMARDLGSVHG